MRKNIKILNKEEEGKRFSEHDLGIKRKLKKLSISIDREEDNEIKTEHGCNFPKREDTFEINIR